MLHCRGHRPGYARPAPDAERRIQLDSTWQRYLDAAGGATRVTGQAVESVLKALVKRGEAAADRAERTLEEVVSRSEHSRGALVGLIRTETARAVAAMGLARQHDVDRLAARVDALEQGRTRIDGNRER